MFQNSLEICSRNPGIFFKFNLFFYSQFFLFIRWFSDEQICCTASEPPKPAPLICLCENGGICREGSKTDELACNCTGEFSGQYCEVFAKQSRMQLFVKSNLIYPFFIAIVLISAVLLFFVLRKGTLWVLKIFLRFYLKFVSIFFPYLLEIVTYIHFSRNFLEFFFKFHLNLPQILF